MNNPMADLEIIGFNGSPVVECGRALPIARRKPDGAHCVLELSAEQNPINWHSEREALAFAKNKQWTRFLEPVSVPESCRQRETGQRVRQPMVVFADETLLRMAGALPRPTSHAGEPLTWRHLEGHKKQLQAACASEDCVRSLLNAWAESLLDYCDAMFRQGSDAHYRKRIADFALCAALDRRLRWRAYLRYATAQEPDRVRRTFDTFTQREFPNVEWSAFIKELSSFKDVLSATPPKGPLSDLVSR